MGRQSHTKFDNSSRLLRNTPSWRKKMKNKYTIEIFFSEEDEGYIAVVPELPGCSAYGHTEEKALEEVKIAINLWIETARNSGRKIPQPNPENNLSRLRQEDWDAVDGIIVFNRLHDSNDKTITPEVLKESLSI